jgi:hypothetical protein
VIRTTTMAVIVLLGAACGGGGGTTDVGDMGDVPPDHGDVAADADADADGDDDAGIDVGPDGDADAEDDAADSADVEDVPDDGDADVAEATKRSVLAVTAGGGSARGGSYGLTLSIGTPQPMGTGSSTGFHGAFGPGAVQGQ